MRATLRDAARFVADDFAAFPRLPIVLGLMLAVPAYALAGPALAGPTFSLGLIGGLVWTGTPDDLPWS